MIRGGTAEGPGLRACQRFSLVPLPHRQIVATLRQYQSQASELARLFARDEQAGASVIDRHVRESVSSKSMRRSQTDLLYCLGRATEVFFRI